MIGMGRVIRMAPVSRMTHGHVPQEKGAQAAVRGKRATMPATDSTPEQTAESAPAQELKTFAEFTGSRPTEPGFPRKYKSYYLPVELEARLAATVRGVQARSYGTNLDGEVPENVSRGAVEALDAWCTYYENIFNEGEPFPPATISPGPGPRGAREGADKRAAARSERADAGDQGSGQPKERAGRRPKRAGTTV